MLIFLGAKHLILLVYILSGFKRFVSAATAGGRCFKRSFEGLPAGPGASSVKNFGRTTGAEVHYRPLAQEDMFPAPRAYTDQFPAANREPRPEPRSQWPTQYVVPMPAHQSRPWPRLRLQAALVGAERFVPGAGGSGGPGLRVAGVPGVGRAAAPLPLGSPALFPLPAWPAVRGWEPPPGAAPW